MKTLPLIALAVKPAIFENPRDSWPSWTDDDRWTTTPDHSGDGSPWTRPFSEPGDSSPDDEPRPTPGPEFTPSPEDLAASVALLNADVTDYWPDSWPDLMEVSTVSDWDYHAELAERARDVEGGVLGVRPRNGINCTLRVGLVHDDR